MVKLRQSRITAILTAALTIAIFLAAWAARDRSAVGAGIKRIEQKFLAAFSHSPPTDRMLHIVNVRAVEVPDPEAEKSVTLSVTVAKAPRAAVDDNKVRTDVFFYESVGEKDIKLTDASVSYDAVSAHDWSSSSTAVYTVDYRRPKSADTDRKYVGYIVCLYYDEKLQDKSAAPAKLLDLFHVPVSETPANASAGSPFATARDFAAYAMKVREQALSKVQPRLFAPTAKQRTGTTFPWKTNIVTTVFWIGEQAGKHVLRQSAWDQNWQANYGGFDNPERSARRNYIPVAFVPHQNPFYCALPYNDVAHGQFKPEAPLVIPWFKQAYMGEGQSVCWHHWIAIRKGNRTCYAQWEDCGPFGADHFQYVFGNERPKPNLNHGAGLNASPAVRDYLGLQPTDVTDWQFVNTQDVPPGPWRSYGENNHFVIARRQMGQKLVQQGGAAETSVQTTAAASPSEACGQFVQQFYDWYVAKQNAMMNAKTGSALEVTLREKQSSFSPGLVKALQEDLAASEKSPGELVGLNFDPFLAAQDIADDLRCPVGEVYRKGDHYFVEVFTSGEKGSEPGVVAELAWQNGKWVFTNFHYGQSSNPDDENLVSVLWQLKKDRKKTGESGTPEPASTKAGVLAVTQLTASDISDQITEGHLLRISVKKRSNAMIDHTKVKIQVFFYDTVGNDMKLTDADVSSEWLTPNHDWADSNTETLAVTCIREKNKTRAEDVRSQPASTGSAERDNRKYLGYIVRVYYNDQLQDKRADPAKLVDLFPAPLVLQSP